MTSDDPEWWNQPAIHWRSAQMRRWWETRINQRSALKPDGYPILKTAKELSPKVRAEMRSHRINWGIADYNAYDAAEKARIRRREAQP